MDGWLDDACADDVAPIVPTCETNARADTVPKDDNGADILPTYFASLDKGVLLTTDEMEEDVVTWDYMILDEGHLIKNPSTQRGRGLLAIPSGHRIIISGTPL